LLQERAEFQVMEASDGLDGVEKAQELQPDLILFDISLPKLSGIESAKRVSRLVPHAKLLFLTQESSADVIREVFRLGAQGYVHKQDAMTDLFPAIEAVLGGRRFVSSGLEFRDGLDAETLHQVLIQGADTADLITERERGEVSPFESDECFRLAMNTVTSGLYTIDLGGLVTYINPAAERTFGWTNAELIGKEIHNVIHYKHPDGTPFPANACPVLQILEKGIELREHQDMFIRKDGSFFPVVFSASPLKKDGKTVGIVVGFGDDTQRRAKEQALHESQKRFRLLANTAPVMIWMSGVDTLCTYFNKPWLDFTGRPLEAEMGNGWAEGVHSEDLGQCVDTYKKAFDQHKSFKMEYRLRRYDGEYRWILDSGVPRFDPDGSFAGYIGSAIDVTQHKLAEAALSVMSQRLIQAQEEERAWIARELHDDIGQRVSLLMLNLKRLSVHTSLTALTEVRDDIGRAIQEVSNLASGTRALSHRLHSSNLEYLGLEAAASTYCNERSEQHKVEINLHSENIPKDLSGEASLCLFRVLQEALGNAIKHSGSRQFRVSLKGGADELELTVHDSGVGFKPEEAIKSPGLGLTSMKERLKLVNGKLFIDSQPGSGTSIHARVPLSLRKEAPRSG
jgi:PAS domain S-box-containing protein